MKLLIEIPEKTYQKIIEGVYDYGDMNVIISRGIPYEERPHGEWISFSEGRAQKIKCSNCGQVYSWIRQENYCSKCGSDNRKGGE